MSQYFCQHSGHMLRGKSSQLCSLGRNLGVQRPAGQGGSASALSIHGLIAVPAFLLRAARGLWWGRCSQLLGNRWDLAGTEHVPSSGFWESSPPLPGKTKRWGNGSQSTRTSTALPPLAGPGPSVRVNTQVEGCRAEQGQGRLGGRVKKVKG